MNNLHQRSLFEKLWQSHEVTSLGARRSLIYIDRVFLHERTGSIALQSLSERKRKIPRPEHVFCTMDHIIDTTPGRNDNTLMPSGHKFIQATRYEAIKAGITLFDLNNPDQGIAHVISPELGIALPGSTLVCPDSHTCTLGAIGALAWGIGSTEAEHAMATRTLDLEKPLSMRIVVNGTLRSGVSAKDLILHIIAEYGAQGGNGYAVEFAGSAIRDMPIEERFTLCNMAVEFSAFTGFIAPDEKTIDWVKGRDYAPKADTAEQAEAYWLALNSDEGAHFDKEIQIDADAVSATVSWGTNPQHSVAVNGSVPNPMACDDPQQRDGMEKALNYMDLKAEQTLNTVVIDAAFIGSCTNSRIADLRAAAAILKNRKIATNLRAVCVPGSGRVKRQAEAEGLDLIFTAAGFEWREPGCSMCFYAGGETFGAGKRVISSTNRNFEGRQGPAVKTHIASPVTVAASALLGRIGSAEEII
ncbi:3-isopropylmalate dehydratase large subunit [Zhongshania aliphaticivorans]|uniref:3-isopropylmalate dehydratase n=1 Tax=Zhongshania aliphaticivorans TaxID=1470434 RepID=A0A5S9N7J8_9GAMM|nr:3-isopropylmalate dehydratase large subunit [Zhongshania aliphaticivorans]CAA0081487.1 3-isopropylmalate dehydratase large subunit [Zhongshania aliphaticivorans]CAA0084863.1 3-isopropylmalate dehydratase large subunit [Zhongshania aliphaticivorans]